MKNIVINAKNLSKKYWIGQGDLKHRLLSERISNFLKGSFKVHRPQGQQIWALRDVSFEVEHGEVFGIIGRNGAGKTTLLKILSRITEPTEGRAVIYGSVSSLLEIGMGFHEELTGRENIYLNGVILGMKRKEIDDKFDEIVEFAEIEKFLDTAVKYYSNGMYVRLGFAIAAHLGTDILLVDEILSVGDMRFQKKCLTKIKEEVNKKRTVLFVSHNMQMINALCSRVLLLDQGSVVAVGDKDSIIKKYIENTYALIDADFSARADRVGSGIARFVRYWLESNSKETSVFRSGEDVVIAASYGSEHPGKLKNVSVSFVIKDSLGNPITDLANRIVGDIWPEIQPKGVIRCHIKKLPLMPGTYTFSVFCEVNGVVSDLIYDAGKFEVEAGSFFPNGRLLDAGLGNVLIDNKWSVDFLQG